MEASQTGEASLAVPFPDAASRGVAFRDDEKNRDFAAVAAAVAAAAAELPNQDHSGNGLEDHSGNCLEVEETHGPAAAD